MQQWFGYGLTLETSLETSVWFYGHGGVGAREDPAHHTQVIIVLHTAYFGRLLAHLNGAKRDAVARAFYQDLRDNEKAAKVRTLHTHRDPISKMRTD